MGAHRCGACTLCCTVMRAEMEPPKPAHETCRHCTDRGCAIYDDRPEVCSGFQCLWLATQQSRALALPAAMRPDRCGVVIDLNPAGAVIAHCERPGSWRREPMRSWLLKQAQRANVFLEMPTGAALLAPDASIDALVKVGVHASGYRLYVRASDLRSSEKGVAA